MSVYGQEKICTLIAKSTLDTFPKTLMLVGPKGSGKHLLCSYITKHLNIDSIDITDNISLEIINEINDRVQPYLYLIKVNELSVKEENTILKLLEEPLKNAYLVLLTETDNGILPTILNRCQIWRLQNYSKDQLATFLSNSKNTSILELVDTPGQLIDLQSTSSIESMSELIDKIINKIHVANLPNILTITDKVAFKNEKDKFDYRIFFKALKQAIANTYKTYNSNNLLDAFILTNDLIKHSNVTNIDVRLLFENYLINLRDLMRRI
jgi:DNA polymerase-3 subunit delta'